ncbi:MAG: RNA polymerase sigma factor [Oceanihabitans sp.]
MQQVEQIALQNIKSRLTEAILANNELVLKSIYKANYFKVESYILKNSGTKTQAKDIFQEAFITVWNNVKSGKFKAKSRSSINGYLYSISRNKWLDFLRSKHFKKTIVASKINQFEALGATIQEQEEYILKEQQLECIMQAFKHLGVTCKSVLIKFYFEKKSMQTIAEELQLDEASTRNKKYRCMQKLKEITLKTKKLNCD